MVCDLHIHTNRYSGCSNIDPMRVLRRAKEAGLDGIALTEHGIRWRDDEIAELVRASGVDITVFPGQEAACYAMNGKFQGEFLVFGYPESLGSNKPVERLIEMVHGEGGVVIAAHPFKRASRGDGFYGSGYDTASLKLDGLEVEHPDYDEESRLFARQAQEKMGIAGLGSSDAHDLAAIGICRTIFEKEFVDVKGLCREIYAGRLSAVNIRRSAQC